MHACSGLLENPSPCTSCLCFPCSAPLKIAQVPRYTPWTLWNTTDQGGSPPAKGSWSSTNYGALGHKYLVGRQYRWSAGQILLQKPVLTAVEDRQGMAKYFQSNVCTNTLLIMFVTQRKMVLDPRTTNRAFKCVMAQEAKACNSILE